MEKAFGVDETSFSPFSRNDLGYSLPMAVSSVTAVDQDESQMWDTRLLVLCGPSPKVRIGDSGSPIHRDLLPCGNVDIEGADIAKGREGRSRADVNRSSKESSDV